MSLTHRVEIPSERLSQWGAGTEVAPDTVANIINWLHGRVDGDRVFHLRYIFDKDVTAMTTDDPSVAAVFTALATEGWDAAQRVADMIDAGAA